MDSSNAAVRASSSVPRTGKKSGRSRDGGWEYAAHSTSMTSRNSASAVTSWSWRPILPDGGDLVVVRMLMILVGIVGELIDYLAGRMLAYLQNSIFLRAE